MDWVLIADWSGLLSLGGRILLVAAGLGLVIFVHELGHFLAAKACGVKCEKFYVGFDIPMPWGLPSSLARFRWGETVYGIGILPLGGYVKMLGQDDNPANQAKENERIRVPASTTVDPAAAASSAAESALELDPRSYPARPVWQRMIIISAGVVMNLVFAVVFATIAYGMGVVYVPCLLGGTAPGEPAWVAGIEGGDQILQLSREGQPNEQLRFQHDLMMTVQLNGALREMDLLVRDRDTARDKWYSIVPSGRSVLGRKRTTLGVFGPRTTQLASPLPVAPIGGHDDVAKQFQAGDEIVDVDGVPLPRDARAGQIFDHHLAAILAQRMTEPLRIGVLRHAGGAEPGQGTPQRVEVVVPPTPLRLTGLVMQPGPIAAVRNGSPADEAGLKAGDRLRRIAGEPIGDPFTLAQRLLPLVGREVEVEVEREGESRVFKLTPRPPQTYVDNFLQLSPVGLDTLGVALPIDSIVADVTSDSPAARAGLRPGDRLVSVRFFRDGQESGREVPLSERDRAGNWQNVASWYFVHHAIQQSSDLELELVVQRPDGAVGTGGEASGHPSSGDSAEPALGPPSLLPPVRLSHELSDQWHYPDRGFNLQEWRRVRTAASFAEALSLGWQETRTSLLQVVILLRRLFTLEVSVRNMGGPLMIAAIAGDEASQGLPRLLTFLTLLSANLAVLNFLPIPALDGGHMMFLSAEAIRGKPVNERVQIALTLVGVACLLSLMVLVLANDLQMLFFR